MEHAALRRVATLVTLWLWAAGALAASLDEDRDQAKRFFDDANCQAALPLLERVAAARPEEAVVAERQAFCLMSAVQLLPPGAQRDDAFARERVAAERARALGDNSNLLQVVLDHLASTLPTASAVIDDAALADAEKAFTRGDLDDALRRYIAIADANPASYEARLFAGDVYFRKHDVRRASEWFRKAIGVDPDRETAYRYWGDALDADGQSGDALDRFIDAIVAEPYRRKAWVGLSQWAERHGAKLVKPNVPTPAAPTQTVGADGKPGVTLTFDASMPTDVNAAWLTYSATRSLWMTEKFAREYPAAAAYRHTLREEAEALAIAAEVAGDGAAKRKEYGDLPRLAADGMLEAYVLLCAPDDGLAQDYADYRAANRERLHDFVRRYVVVASAKH
jgi:tetratricopeptide (TPR) repeat protein